MGPGIGTAANRLLGDAVGGGGTGQQFHLAGIRPEILHLHIGKDRRRKGLSRSRFRGSRIPLLHSLFHAKQ